MGIWGGSPSLTNLVVDLQNSVSRQVQVEEPGRPREEHAALPEAVGRRQLTPEIHL